MIHAPTPNCLRHVLLAILPVTVTSGESIAETFVVWDPGSGATIFTDNLTARLNLSEPSFRVRFSNFNNSVTIESKIVSFQIAPLGSKVPDTEEFLDSKFILYPRKINWLALKKRSHLANLNLPAKDSSQVGVLIGTNQLSAHVQRGINKQTNNRRRRT